MYNVYSQHKGSNVKFPPVDSIDTVKIMANFAAEQGWNIFYRVFRDTGHGEKFEVAFSVLDGVVTERSEVTFPPEHF